VLPTPRELVWVDITQALQCCAERPDLETSPRVAARWRAWSAFKNTESLFP
jgi:hypothetical protein